MARQITFEIDDEIAGHFDAIVNGWKKHPTWLARKFFEEEVLANTSGSRGVPMLRRYLYRDSNVYFTQTELVEREAEMKRNRDPVAEAARERETAELFAKMEENRRKKQA